MQLCTFVYKHNFIQLTHGFRQGTSKSLVEKRFLKDKRDECRENNDVQAFHLLYFAHY